MSELSRCRVCGKEYKACRNANRLDGVFNYKEVACSPECGEVYLRQIMASRAQKKPAVKKSRTAAPESEPVFTPVVIPEADEASEDNPAE